MSARSLNKVLLIGNLTRDPEVRYTPSQTAVTTFGLATNREWSSQNGEKQTSVEFHNLVVWSKLAEICQKFLHKGDKIYVEGRLQTREWQGKDGSNQRRTEVVVENMIMLGGRGNAGADANFDAGAVNTVESQPVAENSNDDLPVDDDSDIPF